MDGNGDEVCECRTAGCSISDTKRWNGEGRRYDAMCLDRNSSRGEGQSNESAVQ